MIDVYLYEQSKVKRKKIKHKQDKTVRASIDPGSMRVKKKKNMGYREYHYVALCLRSGENYFQCCNTALRCLYCKCI